ncbi:MAG: hypothetical protein VYB65_08130 [Myxococcota bacterium]|nr:hypothetical protein [Myxococcota bacterium]
MNHKLLHLGALATLLLTAACGSDGVVDGNQADRWRADAPRNPADDTTPVTPDDTDPEPGNNTPDPQPADPTGATRDDAIAVDADSATPGELTEQKAAAWYRFVAGDAYRYAVYTSGSVDTECALFDGARTQAMEEDDDSGEGLNCRIEAELVEGRSYLVRVTSFRNRAQGGFQLHIDALDAPVVDPEIAARPGEVRAGDVLTIGGSGFSPNGAVMIEISGMATLEVEPTTADADGVVAVNVDVPVDQATGRYQVRALDQESDTPSRWVNFSVTEAPADDHGNDAESATDVGNGGSFGGTLTRGDNDTFSLRINRNGEWTIHTEGTTDTHCTLSDADGNEIASNDDGGEDTNCRIAQELEAPATVLINVRHFRPTGEGEYTLVITAPDTPVIADPNNPGGNQDGDDHADSIEGASLLLPIVPNSGAFDKENDQDWFAFLAPGDGMYMFATIGFVDTVCSLYDADGNRLTRDDNSGPLLNCQIQRSLEGGRIYYIQVVQGRLRMDGTYALVATPPEQAEDDHGNDVAAANFVSDNTEVAGNFEEGGDVDVVRFRATRNGPYRLETTGALDTTCRLLDADANELASNDDSGDAMNCRIEHDLVAGQVYAFSVRGYRDTVTGTYQMRIAIP